MATEARVLDLVYPDSDGEPMADNTLQFEWIVTIKGGLDALFGADPDVFVAGDLLWYPVEGQPRIRRAPDVLVAFGRPKGYRGSYKQWCENNIAPQVVFEVLSPANTPREMATKLTFYTTYGVEEYYLYDPERVTLVGWQRRGEGLQVIERMEGWVSPRLGVRFTIADGELGLYTPSGARFLSYQELALRAEQAQLRADQEQARADQEQARADQEQARADQEQARAEQAQLRADQEQVRADQEQIRAKRLAEKLRALGIDPDLI